MKKLKVTAIVLIVVLVLSYLLCMVNLLNNRVETIEHSIGRINWDIEEAVREIGFLQLEILELEPK